MGNEIDRSEIYGIRSFIEIALNNEERAMYLAKSLAANATKSDLCQDDSSLQELVYTGAAFVRELSLSPEGTSKAIADRLEFGRDGYQSGLLRKLDPKLGEVAQFAESVKKVAAVVGNWHEVEPMALEPGLRPILGDIFASQVERDLVDTSLKDDMGKLNKVFRAQPGSVVNLVPNVRVAIGISEETGLPSLHEDTIVLWMEDVLADEAHSSVFREQFEMLKESFDEHRENYHALNKLKKSRELQLRSEMGNTF